MTFVEYQFYEQRRNFFFERTLNHIDNVREYAAKISNMFPEFIKLYESTQAHDRSKFQEPELTPYIELTWKKKDSLYPISAELTEQIHNATLYHVKNNMHHPEFWVDDVDVINKQDRDAPVKCLECSAMPRFYIAEMCADWSGISKEFGTKPQDWADKNLGFRWKFNEEQTDLIYTILNKIY